MASFGGPIFLEVVMSKQEKKPIWMQDKVKAKIINLVRPGEDIFVSANGEAYLIKDGATVTVPRTVLNILKDSKRGEYTIEGDMEKGKAVKKVDKPNYMAVEIDESNKDIQTEADKKKEKLLSKMNGAKK